MEFPSSILESGPFFFQPKAEILDSFPEDVISVFKSFADKDKSKPDSKQQLNRNDFIEQSSKDSLKLNETTKLNVDKLLEDDDQSLDDVTLNLNTDNINSLSSNNDTISEKLVDINNDAPILGKDSVKCNDTTNSNYNPDTQLESNNIATEQTNADQANKQGTETVKHVPENTEENSSLEELVDESAIYTIFKETFKSPEKKEGEESLTSDNPSHEDDYNNENKFENTNDDFDYMNLPVTTKSEEATNVTEKFEDQIPSPIIYSEPTTCEATSNYKTNEEVLPDSEQEHFEENEEVHPMNPAEFILSHILAPTNSDTPSNETGIENALGNSFSANEPVNENSIPENVAEDL